MNFFGEFMTRVLVSTVPFGAIDGTPLQLLHDAGIDVTINPFNKKLTEGELCELIKPYDGLIAGTEVISKRVLENAPNLKVISRVGIGLDALDLLEARGRNVMVSYTPDAPADAVADLTIGLMFSLLRGIGKSNLGMHKLDWRRIFGRRLIDVDVGVIGVGRVGSRVIDYLHDLGNRSIRYMDRDITLSEREGVHAANMREILTKSDIVSVHVPLDSTTRNLIDVAELSLLKKDAFLINTARGGVVNERALYNALSDNAIGGAAIDVFELEPYQGQLAGLENCILTAHMGSMTFQSRARMEIEATRDIIRFFEGEEVLSPVPEFEYDLRG